MNDLKLFKKYYEQKTKLDLLKKEVGELADELAEIVAGEDNCKFDTKFARFQVVYRDKYKYTDELNNAIKKQMEKIKILKKKEEITGKAKLVKSSGHLRMTDPK